MRKKTILFISLILIIAGIIIGVVSFSNSAQTDYITASTLFESPVLCGVEYNSYASLSVPTQITKIGTDYFLVDCYHNQILTSTTPDAPLDEWYVLTDQIDKGHTIAGDGTVYLADDTENNRILVFEKIDGSFYLTQFFENIGIRPHYIVYDPDSKLFYASSSMTGEIYIFSREKNSNAVFLNKILSIPELNNIYCRSISIIGKDIYFVACNGSILRTSKKDLNVLERWTVPTELAGMVQLSKIGNYYYLTVSTDIYGNPEHATMVRTADLSNLIEYNYEDLSEQIPGEGTPYYISCFDGAYYLTQHSYIVGTGVIRFHVQEDELTDICALHP